jgi:hypothetical protein
MKYPIPPLIAYLLPPAQLEYTQQYYGIFAETIDRLYKTVSAIPNIGDTETILDPPAYLHYYTGTVDYFICEYDGKDTMFGKMKFAIYHPGEYEYHKFSLSNLKSNDFLQLDFSWVVPSAGVVV